MADYYLAFGKVIKKKNSKGINALVIGTNKYKQGDLSPCKKIHFAKKSKV